MVLSSHPDTCCKLYYALEEFTKKTSSKMIHSRWLHSVKVRELSA
uniref:Uncharacterized protein n=1 Tax=Anguilla anguilla TaxID=7936 RepID=A0A0E9R5F3_ANGAN